MSWIFRATEAELRAALPTFKVPLSEPVMRRRRNPFGALEEARSWDPNPDEPVRAGDGVGLVALANLDACTLNFGDFLRLVSLVLGSPYDEKSLLAGRPALIGPPDEDPGPFELPNAFASKLAAMRDEELADLSERWMAASIPDFAAYRQAWEGGPLWAETVKQWHETLVALVDFVRAAASKQQGVYVDISGLAC